MKEKLNLTSLLVNLGWCCLGLGCWKGFICNTWTASHIRGMHTTGDNCTIYHVFATVTQHYKSTMLVHVDRTIIQFGWGRVGSVLDCLSIGRAIDPAPGAWFITIHLISPGLVRPVYITSVGPKTPLIFISFVQFCEILIEWHDS